MKRYKLINGYSYRSFNEGETYLENTKSRNNMYTVKELVERKPGNWELIEELPELPKYWIVENDGSELFKNTVLKYLNDLSDYGWIAKYKYHGFDGNTNIATFKGTSCFNDISEFKNNPTLLTLNEFIKLTKMEQEIIGYKLKNEKFREPCLNMLKDRYYLNTGNVAIVNTAHCLIKMLSDLQLLDLWFEPVYKPKYSLPKINGYEGEQVSGSGVGNWVKYGCKTIAVKTIREMLVIGVKFLTIDEDYGIYESDMRQIVEYFDNI